MVKRISLALLTLLVGRLAVAQTVPGITSGRGAIALAPDVSKELKIAKEQNARIQRALKDMQRRAEAGDLSGIDIMNPMGSIDPVVEGVLTDPQKARLEELFIQKNEGHALTDKKVAEALDLTADQRRRVSQIDAETKPGLTDMALLSRGDFKKLNVKRLEASARLLAVLTPPQAIKLETLKGKPFKFRG